MSDKRFDRLELKLDRLDERLDSIDKTLVLNTASLDEHKRQTIAVEQRVGKSEGRLEFVENHVIGVQNFFKWSGKIIAALAAITTIVIALVKLF